MLTKREFDALYKLNYGAPITPEDRLRYRRAMCRGFNTGCRLSDRRRREMYPLRERYRTVMRYRRSNGLPMEV